MTDTERFLLNVSRHFINNERMDYQNIVESNISELLHKAFQHRIFHLFYQYVKPVLKQSPYWPQFEALWNIENQNRMLHKAEIVAVTRAFNNSKIPHIFIKGIMQEQLLYDGKPLRDTGDIDLIVKPDDQNRAYQVLKSLGYNQPSNQNNELRNTVSRHFWEVSLCKDAVKTITLEIKTASSAVRKNFEKLFDYTQFIELDCVNICTLNPTATLVHIFANAHEANEARGTCKATTIRDYFESLYLLRKIGLSKEIIEIANILESRHKIYEVLRSLDDIYGLTEEEKQFAENFNIDRCGYPFELDGWSNKSEDMNCALLFDPFKPHAETRLFDSDYAFYLYSQALKNAVFNKPVYKCRHYVLQQGEQPLIVPYEGRIGFTFRVAWDKDLHFQVKIDKNIVTEDEWDNTNVEFNWYERDITRPNIRSNIAIQVGETVRHGNSIAQISCLNYFKKPSYRNAVNRICDEYNQHIVSLMAIDEPGFLMIDACIPLEMLPVEPITPTLICEIEIIIHQYSYGDETNAFSFNLYN